MYTTHNLNLIFSILLFLVEHGIFKIDIIEYDLLDPKSS